MKLDFSPLSHYADQLGQAFGFMTPFEIMAMRVAAKSLPESPKIVNIGSGAGTSGLAFVETRPDAMVVTIDISEGGPFGGLENERNAFAPTPLKLPYQMLSDSSAAGRVWKNGPCDLVFIDGDHSYDGCLADCLAWREHVKPGGLLLLHDYDRDVWPDVAKVVNESGALADFECLWIIDTLWIGRRMG